MQNKDNATLHLPRIRFGYGVIVLIMTVFVVRLFYLQVIKHDYYKNTALSGQYKEYQIPAKRGVIEAHNGDGRVPIVLNEVKYTLFADPVYIKDKPKAANKLQEIIGKSSSDIKELLDTNSRYVVLAKKLDESTKKRIEKLEIKGIGLREQSYRTYPQGQMAASLLGFVNDEGEGKYGVEQALNDKLKGTPGQLKAITDARGVPLIVNKDNIIEEPKDGTRVVLTIDMPMQQQLEEILKKGLDRAKSQSGGVYVMEVNTGAIKAMANYPTYNPGEFFKVEDANVFNNTVVSNAYEPGSVMKPLTMASALEQGVVSANSSFYDPGSYKIDDFTITNVENSGGIGNRPVSDILRYSLNTGATWLLMQMGGGNVNKKARNIWHDYMVNKYRFSQKTNIEQGYESTGVVPDPNEGFALDLKFANTAFGQGVTTTPIQVGSAMASVINGGTYYQPRLVDEYINADGKVEKQKPIVVDKNVISEATSKTVRDFMENVIKHNYSYYNFTPRPNYMVGGKTGTAQIANPSGGYYEDRYNGTFTGFLGGDKPEYLIVVRVNEPKIPGYAGSAAAGPIFSDTVSMLIDNFGVLPRSN